jgi:D-threonate/D-erythronate kinase
LVAIMHPISRSPGKSEQLHDALANLVSTLLNRCELDHLLLEGGATASAVCRKINWREFDVVGELATGVVQLKVPSSAVQSIVIKPGSYPWPAHVWGI